MVQWFKVTGKYLVAHPEEAHSTLVCRGTPVEKHWSTQCATDCGPLITCINANDRNSMVQIWVCESFLHGQAIFYVCTLIYVYVCEGSSQPIAQLNMPKNYGLNIFDYEGHNLWHTRYLQLFRTTFELVRFDKVSITL